MRLVGGVMAAGGTLSRLSPCEAANDERRLRPSTFWGKACLVQVYRLVVGVTALTWDRSVLPRLAVEATRGCVGPPLHLLLPAGARIGPACTPRRPRWSLRPRS